MALKELKKLILYGYLSEARQLIEQISDINDILDEEDNDEDNELPLLIFCTLINNENSAYNLCIGLIEKGYNVNITDVNGLCALNYAIIFDRVKLVELFLNTFDFNFNRLYDRHGNSVLHYVFARNNDHIVSLFTNMYKRYYSWNDKFLSSIKNCDGLSVLDLYNYYIDALKLGDNGEITNRNSTKLFKSKSAINGRRPLTAILNKERTNSNDDCNHATFSSYNQNFYRNSNPIFIAKHIKQLYDSKLTMKTVGLIDKNGSNKLLFQQDQFNISSTINKHFHHCNSNRVFQMNHLYKLKKFNRIKSSINIPLQASYQKRDLSDIHISNNNVKENYFFKENLKKTPLSKSKDAFNLISINDEQNKNISWKNNVTTLLADYAVLSTSSYRNPFVLNRALVSSAETTSAITNDSVISTNRPLKFGDETLSSVNTARSGGVNVANLLHNDAKLKIHSNDTDKSKNGFIKSTLSTSGNLKSKNQ